MVCVATDQGGEETGGGSGSEQGNTNPNPDTNPGPTNVTINLQELASKIKETNIVIKPKVEDGQPNHTTQKDPLERKRLYAFNVVSDELAINGVDIPETVKVSFDLNSNQNTVTNLNKGMLNVEVTLKNEGTNPAEYKQKLDLTGFKTVDVTKEFPMLFENNMEYVLKIEPSMNEGSVQYTNLTELNKQNIAATPARRVRDTETSIETRASQTTNGLTQWLNKDTNKMMHATGIKIEGQVKLEKISGDESGSKAYFHLVSKDSTNRIKLVKAAEQDAGNLEVLVSEIKTTNLLASDISVSPKMIAQDKQADYLKSLQSIKNGEEDSDEQNKKYLMEENGASLNRSLYVNLGSASDASDIKETDKLFVKPYVANRPEGTEEVNLDLSITVSFGEKDYVTSFNTTNPEELMQLKAPGFKFGLYTKTLTGQEAVVDATTFTNKKSGLMTYFKTANYITSSARSTMSSPSYPGGFSLTSVDKEMLDTGLVVKLAKQNEPIKSANLLAFADYSYGGISMEHVLFTPTISIIRVVSISPLA